MYLPIGAIVSDTVKTEPRFKALLCSLLVLSDDEELEKTLGEALDRFARLWESRAADNGRDSAELFEELCELAEEHLAPYTYLGNHEGPADFGVWPMTETLEDDAREGIAVLKRNDGVPFYVMQVSDHGNVTLWETHAKEVWSLRCATASLSGEEEETLYDGPVDAFAVAEIAEE